MSACRRACCCLLIVAGLCPAALAFDEAVDAARYTNPNIPLSTRVPVFSPRLVPLWLQALERPEVDYRRLAAATIVVAHKRGMPGLEKTIPPLLKAVDQPDQDSTVCQAAAQALVALDARQAAASLFRLVQAGDSDLRNVVEPALARWDHTPARDMWLERLAAPAAPRQSRVLAMQGLGAVREERAVPRLRELVLAGETDPLLRVEAARALGRIRTSGLEPDAERLTAATGVKGMPTRLAAATLLQQHRGETPVRVLQRLAGDPEPAVAAVALETLLAIDPRHVVALARQTAANRDAKVRGLAVQALGKVPTLDLVPLLADLMNDPHPDVRTQARKVLREQARAKDFDGSVRKQATRVLAGSNWRGLEQATILLTTLDHKPAAPRFVALLRAERPEVLVTAAWGLRRLAVPATLPQLVHAIEWRLKDKPDLSTPDLYTAIDLQVGLMAEALGEAKYRPAVPLLRRLVPKGSYSQEARAGAVWALGLILGTEAPPDLVKALIVRLNDMAPAPPEAEPVRRMCAITLGRVKAKEAVPSLRKHYPNQITEDFVGNACGWALQEITGEKLPPPGKFKIGQHGWFLESLD